MQTKIISTTRNYLFGLALVFLMITFVSQGQFLAAENAASEASSKDDMDYPMDRPLLAKGKSLQKASSVANVDSLAGLKAALTGNQDEIYINQKITITEDIEFPAGKLLLRGYNCCYDTMFVIPDGVTVTVQSEIDASGDQTRLYTGPVFDVASGGKLRILSGSIYGSVSENDGGAITNRGTVEIKGGILQGHTTTKRGGAIYNEGKLTITGGQLLDNRAIAKGDINAGGAIFNAASGTLFLNGGVSQNNFSLGKGGAVYNEGTLTIDRGRISGNKAQKNGNGIYSTQDVTYTGKYYVNLDEVITEKNILIKGTSFQNASSITANGFTAGQSTGNNGNGKLTCNSLTGAVGNDGSIYYNGEGSFSGKVTGDGQFHTSKVLTIDAPEFVNHLMVDKGELTIEKAEMKDHDITVSSGTLKSGQSGTVKVRSISLCGGTYIIANAPLEQQMGSLTDCKYLDAQKIQCSNDSKLTVNCRNKPELNGKDTFYVPIGRQVSMSQSDVNRALLKNPDGTLVNDAEKYGRALRQESGATYIKVEPAALFNLKVIFQDENGTQQIFYQDGNEKVHVSLTTAGGYRADATRIADSDGFLTEGNANYGGYQFTSVPSGMVTVYASFSDTYYRSLSKSTNLKSDDTIILTPYKMNIGPTGVWWTDDGNYDVDKYNQLKSAGSGAVIEIKNARELAAVSKIVGWPVEGDTAKNLSGITIELKNDIDLSGYQWKPIGSDGGAFSGIFNGQKHTISNMSIGYPQADTSLRYVGLFGFCSGNISNVTVKDCAIQTKAETGTNDIGALVGKLGGTIKECYVQSGNMSLNVNHLHSSAGGLVGESNGSINKCGVEDLKMKTTQALIGQGGATTNIGGFIGSLSVGMITASKAENGIVDAQGQQGKAGGFVGWINSGKISNCFSKNEVKATYLAGGFAGDNLGGEIQNCYSAGNVYCNYMAGGFIGEMWGDATVKNCYSTANVTASRICGFSFDITNGNVKIDNCYASGKLAYISDMHKNYEPIIAGFILVANRNSTIKNCFFTGSMSNENIADSFVSKESGFIMDNSNVNCKLDSNYTLADITHKGAGNTGGFGVNITANSQFKDNFYYSNIGRATATNKNEGIVRILEPSQIMAGKRSPVTYTLHTDLPGGAKVTDFQFDNNIPGASIKALGGGSYEVTPEIDFGVLHLTGTMTVSHAKLAEPTGDFPAGWDFKVSPADTTMQVSEDLLICKVDYENEQILAPNIDGLKKNNAAGTVDAANGCLRFNIQDGDFANIIPFASPDLQCAIFIPERPKVPVVNCSVSTDKQLLLFTTNDKHSSYQEENAIRPNTGYEYSLDGGNNYQRVKSTSDGKVVIQLTAGVLNSWPDISKADDIRDARLRLAATDSSFRSKAMAEEAGFIVEPPKPSEDAFQVTYYMNNGTNEIYQASTCVDGKITAPVPPTRSGFSFKGWYTQRVSEESGAYDFTQPVTASLKLYAHWENVTYTIKTQSSLLNGAEHIVYAESEDKEGALAQGTFREGTRVVLEASVTDEKHTFQYWKEGDVIVSTQPVFTIEVTKDQTFTACFQANGFQITYYQNDGTQEIYHTDITADGKAKAPEPPTRTGYVFKGWYKEAEGGTLYDFAQPVTADTVLYAHWETVTYTIKTESNTAQGVEHLVYDAAKDRTQGAAEGTFAGGTKVRLDAASIGEQHVFQYWKEGGAVVSTQPVFEIEVSKDQTFTACFKPVPNAPAAPVWRMQTDHELQIITAAGQEYAIRKMGEASYGTWQTSGMFTGLDSATTYQIVTRTVETEVLAASRLSSPLEVMTLKSLDAGMEQRDTFCTVTFMDGSTVLKIQEVEKGKPAQAPEPQKAGYQLSWSIPFNNVTSDLIVRAVWKPNSYTIGFLPNGGKLKGNNKKTVVYGRAYEELPQPVKKGYSFKGWYTKKSGGTKITGQSIVAIEKDTTYYAQWSKVSPKKASLKSVKNVKGYKAIITWAKMPGADGYRLEYSTDSKFTKKATKTVKVKASAVKSNKPTKTISRLKKGKTYYVRISVYQKDSAGKTYYGKNSTVKKVNIRK